MRSGIDTGGAFTDFVYLGNGAGRVHKTPSTPRDPLEAIVIVPSALVWRSTISAILKTQN